MRRVLICGGGEAGIMVLSEILKHPEERIEVLGFIDDDRDKIGRKINGVPVKGGRKELKGLIMKLSISEVIIAMPSIPKTVIRDIVRTCRSEKVKLLIVPSTMEIIEGTVRFDQIKQLDLADLLDRDEVRIDSAQVRDYFHGKRVLVTGAAGSIGSTIVAQLLSYQPAALLALDMNENSLFYLSQSVAIGGISGQTRFLPLVADIKDSRILADIFRTLRPEIVFHAAAYKHVPLMENHVRTIFLNNVVGTQNLLEAAQAEGAEKFIGISTDKAVYPVSVMGRTKRICELLVSSYHSRGLQSCSVRFGNVLGSNGSVLTVFQEQISRGGPVTITSPYMERYFMTVQEATSLVLQAAATGGGGDIYVLDMGSPIRIRELAESVIILSGRTPGVDIKIDYTGVRAGEKYTEELFYREGEVCESSFKGIFVEKVHADPKCVLETVDSLADDVYRLTAEEIKDIMDRIVKGGERVFEIEKNFSMKSVDK